jgi:hypothetical protein
MLLDDFHSRDRHGCLCLLAPYLLDRRLKKLIWFAEHRRPFEDVVIMAIIHLLYIQLT